MVLHPLFFLDFLLDIHSCSSNTTSCTRRKCIILEEQPRHVCKSLQSPEVKGDLKNIPITSEFYATGLSPNQDKSSCIYKAYSWVKTRCRLAPQNTPTNSRFYDKKAISHTYHSHWKQLCTMLCIFFLKLQYFHNITVTPLKCKEAGNRTVAKLPQQFCERLFAKRGRNNLLLPKNVPGIF